MNKHYVADISGNPKDHKKLILYKYKGSNNQKFHVEHHNGKYAFKSVEHGDTIQVHDGSTDNGAKIHGHHRKHHHY